MPDLWPSHAHAGRTSQSRSLGRPTDPFLRAARLLRSIPEHVRIAVAKVLLEGVPACDEARYRARTTMARASHRITAVGRLRRLPDKPIGTGLPASDSSPARMHARFPLGRT